MIRSEKSLFSTNESSEMHSEIIYVKDDGVEFILPIINNSDKFIVSPVMNHGEQINVRLNKTASQLYDVTVVNNTNRIMNILGDDKIFVLNYTSVYGAFSLSLPAKHYTRLIRTYDGNMYYWSGLVG
jgi:hypothetical protein